MNVIVCGGRDFKDEALVLEVLTGFHHIFPIDTIVSGGCIGADIFGETWAAGFRICVKRFLPDWVAQGKKAGPLRNEEMALYSDACIAFPGGKGTADMVRRAKAHRLFVLEITPGKP